MLNYFEEIQILNDLAPKKSPEIRKKKGNLLRVLDFMRIEFSGFISAFSLFPFFGPGHLKHHGC